MNLRMYISVLINETAFIDAVSFIRTLIYILKFICYNLFSSFIFQGINIYKNVLLEAVMAENSR